MLIKMQKKVILKTYIDGNPNIIICTAPKTRIVGLENQK